jgi:hypothetical protein
MKTIAVSLLVVSFVFHPGVGHAAWLFDGNAITVAPGQQDMPAVCPDGKGGTIIAWEDNRSGNFDIYAQRLDGLGVPQWESNVVICSAQDDQVDPLILSDAHGGAIVVWQDKRNGNWDIFAQRVNSAGILQWETTNGVALTTVLNNQFLYGPTIVSDGSGGAIVTWRDERTGTNSADIYARRVTIAGDVLWTDGGVAVCDAGGVQSVPAIVPDNAGGAIVAWQDERNGTSNADIYAQRLDASGNSQWLGNGVAVCSSPSNQQYPSAVPDGAGGAIVVWQDYRNGYPNIYAQRLDASGNSQWTGNGMAIYAATNWEVGPQLVSDGVGGAIVAWDDNRIATDANLYAQRINHSGVAQWTAGGVVLCSALHEQLFDGPQPQMVIDGAGGAFVTWQDDRNGDAGDIFAQQVSASGQLQLTPNGTDLCTAPDKQWYPMINSPASGSAVVTWQDERSGNWDVYALPVSNTMIGRLVRYVPYPNGLVAPGTPDLYPIHLLFNSVVTAGFTYLDITPAGPTLPPSFVLGDGRYYNLSTTAGSTDNIQVCIKFDPAALQHPAAALRMFEYSPAGPAGPTWLDVTTQPAMGDSICATTTNLSTFVIGFPSVTGVRDTPLPASFALHSNVPNPFNPITTISYDVPAPGADVSISIYDVSGKLIRSLVKEHRGAGTWSVQWNGDNDRGQGVASGVYFYRMRAGEFVETRKMMLLK